MRTSALLNLERQNQSALCGSYERQWPIEVKMSRVPYRGFVDVCIGPTPFLMFSNNDDVVAMHYLYDERPGFEATSLRAWWALARLSDAIYDVGAFTGVYALSAAAANPSAFIYAFEPAANTFFRLATNILANQFDGRIAPIQVALGETTGRAELRHLSGLYVLGSGESLVPSMVSRPAWVETVEVVAGDELLSLGAERLLHAHPGDRVTLAKIDVEGFEREVVRGLGKAIATHQPTLLVECRTPRVGANDRGSTPAQDRALLADLHALLGKSYRSYLVDEDARAMHRDFGRYTSGLSRNVLFVADGRRDETLAALASAGISVE